MSPRYTQNNITCVYLFNLNEIFKHINGCTASENWDRKLRHRKHSVTVGVVSFWELKHNFNIDICGKYGNFCVEECFIVTKLPVRTSDIKDYSMNFTFWKAYTVPSLFFVDIYMASVARSNDHVTTCLFIYLFFYFPSLKAPKSFDYKCFKIWSHNISMISTMYDLLANKKKIIMYKKLFKKNWGPWWDQGGILGYIWHR